MDASEEDAKDSAGGDAETGEQQMDTGAGNDGGDGQEDAGAGTDRTDGGGGGSGASQPSDEDRKSADGPEQPTAAGTVTAAADHDGEQEMEEVDERGTEEEERPVQKERGSAGDGKDGGKDDDDDGDSMEAGGGGKEDGVDGAAEAPGPDDGFAEDQEEAADPMHETRDCLVKEPGASSSDENPTLSRNHPVFEFFRQQKSALENMTYDEFKENFEQYMKDAGVEPDSQMMEGLGAFAPSGMAGVGVASGGAQNRAGQARTDTSAGAGPDAGAVAADGPGAAAAAAAAADGMGAADGEPALRLRANRSSSLSLLAEGYLDAIVLKFTTLSEGGETSSFRISGPRSSIGREESNQVSVPSDRCMVETGHAFIEHDGGAFFLVDGGHEFGAAVRLGVGVHKRQWPLDIGAAFSVGNSVFRAEEINEDGHMVLKVTSGPLKGDVHVVSQSGATLGRSSDNGISVADRELSRRHSRIEFDDGRYFLCDVGSTNGTYMQLVGPYGGPRKLNLSDHILVGRTGFSVNRYDYGISEDKGHRRTMEDSCAIVQHLNVLPLARFNFAPQSFYGVYDGHGGPHASLYLSQMLHVHVAEALAEATPKIIELIQQSSASATTRSQRDRGDRDGDGDGGSGDSSGARPMETEETNASGTGGGAAASKEDESDADDTGMAADEGKGSGAETDGTAAGHASGDAGGSGKMDEDDPAASSANKEDSAGNDRRGDKKLDDGAGGQDSKQADGGGDGDGEGEGDSKAGGDGDGTAASAAGGNDLDDADEEEMREPDDDVGVDPNDGDHVWRSHKPNATEWSELRSLGIVDAKCLARMDALVKDALCGAFVKTDSEFIGSSEHAQNGSTATTALVMGKRIYCANVGDSRTLVCRNFKPWYLSRDHKPTLPEEAARIRQAGGFVIHNRVMGELAVSRAFGDAEFKKGIQSIIADEGGIPPQEDGEDPKDWDKPLIVAEPEVKCATLTDQDQFVVLACDGLFDVFVGEDVIKIVKDEMEEHGDANRACQALTHRAIHERGSRDNVSVVLVILKPWF